MDEEFVSIMQNIKAAYHALEQPQEKSKVQRLIRDLAGLSLTDEQRVQRNELAKALLFKLKYSGLFGLRANDSNVSRLEEKCESGDNQVSGRQHLCDLEITQEAKYGSGRYAPVPSKARRSQLRDNYRKKEVKRKKNDQLYRRNMKLRTSNFLPHREMSLRSQRERVEELRNSATDTDTVNRADECGDGETDFAGEKVNNVSGQRQRLSLNEQLKEVWSRNAGQKLKAREYGCPESKVEELQQRAQMAEADFYEHLVEVRRESEIELAKTITRKNAELKALQEETECKHREMKQSVDMLERQLAAAIENADQVRRQCEEQSKQMQASINAQLEKLFQENAEHSEHLDQKHAEEIHQLKTAHDSDLLRLKEQTATVEKLRADLNEQARHVKQMEILCAELTEERNNALEQRQLMEHELNERTERIVEMQNELNETSLRLRNLEVEHDRCLRQQTDAIMHMQHETVKQMSKTQQNCTDALNALNTMIGQLTAEVLARKFSHILYEYPDQTRFFTSKLRLSDTYSERDCIQKFYISWCRMLIQTEAVNDSSH
ncbi:unnamed protein product [Dicrocoelium dendriticum]|nr:unnamed protein product [Dicrocoelium dendriticum]